MNRFINYVIKQSEKLDLTLKMNYSSKCGWVIQLHEKGYDMPVIAVRNQDKEKAFIEAHEKVKGYICTTSGLPETRLAAIPA